MTTKNESKNPLSFTTEDLTAAGEKSFIAFFVGIFVAMAEKSTENRKKVTQVIKCGKCGREHKHEVTEVSESKNWRHNVAETNTKFSRIRESGSNAAWAVGAGTLLYRKAEGILAWSIAGRITTQECIKNKQNSKAVRLKTLKKKQ